MLLACSGVLAVAASSAQAAGLPDGRAYEQVTPANKDNGDPYLRAGIFGGYQAAATGDAFTFPSLYGFPGSPSNGISYLSTRGTSGWSTANQVPPQSTQQGALCAAFTSTVGWSADMSKNVLADGANQASGCGTDHPLLAPGTTSGGLPLCSAKPLVTPCSGEAPKAQNLFVRDTTTNTFQLVNNLESAPSGVTPADANFDGSSSDMSHVVFDESAQLTSDAPSASDDLYEWDGSTVSLVTKVPSSGSSCSGSACTAVVGSIAGGGLGNALHAVTDSNVAFTANGNLYVRQNGTSTVQVDAGIGGGGQFEGASTDGSKVFFMDSGDSNLYEYDFASSGSHLTDLTPGGSAQLQGVSGMSSDGSVVYFIAESVLASNANGDGQTAQAGELNLYAVNTATAGDPITFIATLGSSDGCNVGGGCDRVSSNGAFIAITSTSSLTGYNNKGAPEIFLSDSSGDGLSCASCIPGGTPATSGASIMGPEGAGIAGNTLFLQRYVSDTGQVFFNTSDALLPTAANGAQNVYEYEAGQVHLISSGTSADDSLYLDSSPSGSDVFFTTSQVLVPQDIDGSFDIYDARVGGGFPVPTPTTACQGESCKPPQSAPLVTPSAGSSTFTGPGNSKSGTGNAKVTVVKRTVKHARFSLHVKVSAGGQIVASGGSINRVSRSVKRAGTYTLTVHLTRKAKNRLKHKRKLKLSIRVQYLPSAGSASTVKVNPTAKA